MRNELCFKWYGDWVYFKIDEETNLNSTGSGTGLLEYYLNRIIKDGTKEQEQDLKRIIKGMSNTIFSRELISLSPDDIVRHLLIKELNEKLTTK